MLAYLTLDVFLDFQTRFGGYRPDDDFTCGIVGLKDRSGEPRLSQRGNMQVVRCDLENISQIRMTIDENAVYYHDEHASRRVVRVLHSLQRLLAQVLAPLRDLRRGPAVRTKRFQEFLQKLETAPLISRVSDQYHWVRHNICTLKQFSATIHNSYIRQDCSRVVDAIQQASRLDR